MYEILLAYLHFNKFVPPGTSFFQHMGSKVEDVAKAMREKSVLDHFHCMLEFDSPAGSQEKVEETIPKMDTIMGDKFLVDSCSEKVANTMDDSGDGSINDDGTVSEVE